MTIYQCERCHYETHLRSDFKRHLEKKVPCPTTHSTIDPTILLENLLKPKAFPCQHCNKSFAFPANLTRHVNKDHPIERTKRIRKIIDKYINSTRVTNKKEEKEDIEEEVVGYIYLIREREFVRLNEPVYKHGKTRQKTSCDGINRLKAYKHGSELVMVKQVPEYLVDVIEKMITKTFKHCFQKHKDGWEYFIGDPFKMTKIIDDIIYEFCLIDKDCEDSKDDEEYLIEDSDEGEEGNQDDIEVDNFDKQEIEV